jgi:hypothetical protein
MLVPANNLHCQYKGHLLHPLPLLVAVSLEAASLEVVQLAAELVVVSPLLEVASLVVQLVVVSQVVALLVVP